MLHMTLLTSMQTCEDVSILSTKESILLLFAVNENASHWILFAADLRLRGSDDLQVLWRLHDSMVHDATKQLNRSQQTNLALLQTFVYVQLLGTARFASSTVSHEPIQISLNGPQSNSKDCGVFVIAAMDAEVSHVDNEEHKSDIIPILRCHIAALFVAIAKIEEDEDVYASDLAVAKIHQKFLARLSAQSSGAADAPDVQAGTVDGHRELSHAAPAAWTADIPNAAGPTAPATSSSSAPGPGLASPTYSPASTDVFPEPATTPAEPKPAASPQLPAPSQPHAAPPGPASPSDAARRLPQFPDNQQQPAAKADEKRIKRKHDDP